MSFVRHSITYNCDWAHMEGVCLKSLKKQIGKREHCLYKILF